MEVFYYIKDEHSKGCIERCDPPGPTCDSVDALFPFPQTPFPSPMTIDFYLQKDLILEKNRTHDDPYPFVSV